MIKMMNRISSTAMLAVAFILCATSAWAVNKPLAVWNGDFEDNDSRGGFTLKLNGNAVASDKSIVTIGNSSSGSTGGITVITNDTITTTLNNIAVVYGLMTNGVSLSSSPALFGANSIRATDLVGLRLDSTGACKLIWNGGDNSSGQSSGTFPNDGDIHYVGGMFARHVTSGGARCYVDGTEKFYWNGGDNGGNNLYGADICGLNPARGATKNMVGAEINYIAVFASNGDTLSNTAGDQATIAAWSLTNMTATETIASSGGSITSGNREAYGVNLNGGTANVTDDTTIAALFVQAPTTLSVANGKILTVNGPVYVTSENDTILTVDISGWTQETLCAAVDDATGSGAAVLIDGTVFGNVSITGVPSAPDGYVFTADTGDGVRIIVTKTGVNYSASVVGDAEWNEKTGVTSEDTWVNSPRSTITISNDSEATLTFDEDVTAESLTLNGTGKITLKRSNNATVSIGDNSTYTKAIIVNTEAVIEDLGQSAAIRITDSNKATLKDYSAFPAGSTLPSTGTLRMESDDVTLTSFPCAEVNVAGTIEIAQPITLTGAGLQLHSGKPAVTFESGTTASLSRLVLGNGEGATQNVTQEGGSITVTGTNGPTDTSASVLIGHWPSYVTFWTKGGTFTATGAASRLAWANVGTGSSNYGIWKIGGGSGTATANLLGIKAGDERSGMSAQLDILEKGTLNLGSFGVQFLSDNGTINLSGGTIAATADTVITNGASAKTVLTASKETTVDTGTYNVIINAALSGSGDLKKIGSGNLEITQAGTASGVITVAGGKLIVRGNGNGVTSNYFNIKPGSGNTATLEFAPGSGNTIEITSSHLANSSDGTPIINFGEGTTVISTTGSSATGSYARSDINILDGAVLKLNKSDSLGYHINTTITIEDGGVLHVAKRETNTRSIVLNGGSIVVEDSSSDGRGLDFSKMTNSGKVYQATLRATANSEIRASSEGSVANPEIWIRGGSLPVTVDQDVTLSLNIGIGTGGSGKDSDGTGLNKLGAGTLALNGDGTKGFTYNGTTDVDAGTLYINATQTGSAYDLAAGTTLKFGPNASLTVPSLTLPSQGMVVFDVSDLSVGVSGVTLISCETIQATSDISHLSVTDGYYLQAVNGAIKVYPLAAIMTKSAGNPVKYPSVDFALNALSQLSASDPDAYVTIISGVTSYDEATLESVGIVYDESDDTYGFAAAEISTTKYTTVAKAIAGAADSGDTITLLRDCSIENLSLGGKSITLNEGDYTFTGSFTGSGTLIMTAMPKALASARWAAGWEGVLWLKNVVFSNLNPGKCGSSNSTLKMTGCSGSFNEEYNSGNAFAGTLELEDDGETPALTVTEGFPAHGYTLIGALKGSGTLKTADSGRAQCFRFLDATEFGGSITILDASTMRIAFGNGSTNYKSESYRKIIVESGASATVAAGKAWTAPGGFAIDGNLSVANTGALSGTISGGGTITYAALPASAPTFGAWTGTVVLPTLNSIAGDTFSFNDYGISGSTVRVTTISGGWVKNETVNPTIDIGTSLALTDFSAGSANTFTKIMGSGALSLSCNASSIFVDADNWYSNYSAYFLINDLSEFNGSISVSNLGLAIGDSKPGYRTPGGKIILNSSKAATVGASSTWTATTIQVGGNLSVAAGGTLSGEVEILGGGSLESANNTALTNLKLNDGAKIVFPTASSTLSGITSVTFASGTTTLALADGQATGTLIDWSGASLESAPAGGFQIEGEAAGLYVVTKNTSGLSIAAAAARIGDTAYAMVDSAIEYLAGHRDAVVEVLVDGWKETDSTYSAELPSMGILWNSTARTYAFAEANIDTHPTSYYATIDEALSAAESGDIKTVNLNKNLTTNPVLPADVSLNLGNYTLTGTVTAAAGYVPSKRTVDGKVVYTADPDTTGEDWTDRSGDHAWNNANNWSLGFVPVATTPVTFSSEGAPWTVALAVNDGDNGHKCASMAVNGNVEFQRANSGTWAYVTIAGDITGSATLTLNKVGLKASVGTVSVACPMVCNGTGGDTFFAGETTYTFSSTVGVSGLCKAESANTALIFNGTVTINDAGPIKANGSGSTVTYNGGIVVPAGVAATLTNGSGSHTIASQVTLNSGSSLSIPNTATVSSETFAAWSPLYNVVSSDGEGSTTVYSAEKKPGTIFSVY